MAHRPTSTTTPLRHPALVRVLLSAALALSVVAGCLAATATAASASATTDAAESELYARTNQARTANGRAELAYDAGASVIAREWSARMASENRLYHNPSLADQITTRVTASWSRLGENVGYGGSIAAIQDAFLSSAPHTANILGDYNRVGVGVAVGSNGNLWVTVVFIKGPPLPTNDPFGSFEFAAQVLGGIRVAGWAIDPETSAAIEVHVYVDNGGTNLGPASVSRSDVGNAFPSAGPNHGFDAIVAASPGWHNVCAYAINVGMGANRQLGCRWVNVNPTPFGSFEVAAAVPGGVRVGGWAIDPDTSSPIQVHVYVDNGGNNLGSAGQTRTDVGSMYAYAGYGSSHGFGAIVGATPGWHSVCAYAINVGAGSNRLLGCSTVFVDPAPIGSLDAATAVNGGIRVAGWGIDPETSASIDVHVYVDSAGNNLGAAAVNRPDVAAIFNYIDFGSKHGYDTSVPAARGWHRVCAYAINVGWGANRLLGCRDVYVS